MEKSIKDLLARLPIPGLKEAAVRNNIAEVLSKELTIPIKSNQITFKEGVVIVTVPPIVKSAIQIKQKILLDALTKEGITARAFK